MANVLNGFDQQPDTLPISLSGVRSIDALLGEARWAAPAAGKLTLTFSFPYANSSSAPFASGADYSSLGEPQSSFGLNAAQKQGVRDALAQWSQIANIDFVEVAETSTSVGVMRFAWTNRTNGDAVAWAYDPNDFFAAGGDVWLGATTSLGRAADADWRPGGDGYATLVHEIGHALGLKHPFDGAIRLSTDDSTQYTVMSYNQHPYGLFMDVTQTGNSVRYELIPIQPDSPMLYDIAAVQYLYGVNTQTTSGSNTYTVSPDVPFIRTLWDGGGADTLSAAAFTRGVTIDLRPGSFSSLTIPSDTLPSNVSFTSPPPTATYDGTKNLAIANGTIIENAVGGSGNDQILGNDAANRLQGGLGNDRLEGGLGIDTAVYASSRLGANVTVINGSVTVTGSEGTDSLAGMERLEFTDRKIALDLLPTQNAGLTVQALGVLAPNLVATPSIVGAVLTILDQGSTLPAMMQSFVDTGVIAALAGDGSAAAVARMAFRNVVGAEPDAAIMSVLTGLMEGPTAPYTQAQFLAAVAQLEITQLRIGLVGLQSTGVVFG